MLVEEVPKSNGLKNATVYFTSSINLTPRLNNPRNALHQQSSSATGTTPTGNEDKKGRAKVNYNVNSLMNNQLQIDTQSLGGPLKTTQQIQLERVVSKRLNELNREGSAASFELPKNLIYNSIHSNEAHKNSSRLGSTPNTKKILLARRNLNLYFEEERNIISINTILNLNYQFVDSIENGLDEPRKKRKIQQKRIKPRLKLCCICGGSSGYARCYNCGLFYCSVVCNNLHNELRCV